MYATYFNGEYRGILERDLSSGNDGEWTTVDVGEVDLTPFERPEWNGTEVVEGLTPEIRAAEFDDYKNTALKTINDQARIAFERIAQEEDSNWYVTLEHEVKGLELNGLISKVVIPNEATGLGLTTEQLETIIGDIADEQQAAIRDVALIRVRNRGVVKAMTVDTHTNADIDSVVALAQSEFDAL